MRVRAFAAGLILPVLFIAGIVITSAAGYWRTESSKEPAVYTSGEFEGEYNPGDIRGSYSFEDIKEAFGIPVNVIAEAYGFQNAENPAGIQVKEFEEYFTGAAEDMEIGTDSVRLFVALYKGLPYEPEPDTALPASAWTILGEKGKADESVIAEYSDRVIETAVVDPNSVSADVQDAESHEEETEEMLIKGKTTFGELIKWGITKEQLKEILGADPGASGTAVRDFCAEQGIEFSTVKEPIQSLLDAM